MSHTNEHTNEPARTIDEIGGNPHAEAPPIGVQFHEWSTRPVEWSAKFASDTASAFGALAALLDDTARDFTREAGPLARLLESVADSMRYQLPREDSRFVRFGPLVVPTSPRGLDALRAIRTHANELVTGTSPRSVLDDSSPLALLLDEIERTSRMRRSGILASVKNRTSSADSVDGFRLAFGLHARAMGAMPNGTTLPPALLGAQLVGREIDGNEAEELRSDLDMCASGTIEFLDRFGISYEGGGGSYECGECGSEHESDECEEIESIDDFTLTSDMLDALDRQGYGEGVREFFGAEDGCDEWSGMLESCDNAEILARCAPNAEDGISYDSSVWKFVPEFEEIDGLESLEWSEQARVLPLLVEIAQAHATASVLPPIGGTLVYQPAQYESRSVVEPVSYNFDWSPQAGTLTHTIAGPLALVVDARNGGARIVHTIDGQARGAALTHTSGADYMLDAPAYASGERAAMLLGIVKGSAGI